MRQSELFTKTKKEPPKDATTVSHKLFVQADFIDQLISGVYSFLPLGWRVHRNIENIIREEMNALGGQEVFLPVLQSKALWEETGRWETIDPPLFKFRDRHDKELALGSTHEEVITDLVRKRVHSYTDLPLKLYQIQDKFRNEMRSQGGLLRVREFIMKDLYSFHRTPEDLAEFYKSVIGAYKNIFKRCGITPIVVKASGGTIGGNVTNEFMVAAKSGEDIIFVCKSCEWAANKEVFSSEEAPCPSCGDKLSTESAIEAGHIFSLETQYSKKMNAFFTDADGEKKPLYMGCYGIGVGRLMATIIEVHHDEKGMIWPREVAPFDIHLVSVGTEADVQEGASRVYKELEGATGVSGKGDGQNIAHSVLYDDRRESAGVKLKDADLIGIPVRVVVSSRTLEKKSVEVKMRNENETRIIPLLEIRSYIDSLFTT